MPVQSQRYGLTNKYQIIFNNKNVKAIPTTSLWRQNSLLGFYWIHLV